METNITEDLLEKAKQAKSAEELLAMVKENGVELSGEQVQELFGELSTQGGLSDEEVENVSGGSDSPKWYVRYSCSSCGDTKDYLLGSDPLFDACPNCGEPNTRSLVQKY